MGLGFVRFFCALALVHSFIRLFYGVDFFDEAYWVGFQWRFALGDRPYLDEHSFHQNFAVFLFPFVALFRLFHPSSEGVVLFTRLLFFTATALGAWFTYRFFRRRTSESIALLFTTLFLLLPIEVPGFSYTSMGIYGVYLGALCLFEATDHPTSGWGYAAGILHAIAVASDPSQIPTIICLYIAALTFTTHPKKFALHYALALLGIGIGMLCYAGPTGLTNIWQSSQYLDHATYSVHFFKHAKDLLAIPYRPLWLCLLIISGVGYWRGSRALLTASAWGLPIACFLIVRSMGYGNRFYFSYFGLSGLLVFLAQKKDAKLLRVFWSFWIPSIVASIVYVWAGNLGGVARFGNGMVLAVFATQYFLLRFMQAHSLPLPKVPFFLTLVSLGLLTLRFHPYSGEARFTSGPYWGLKTEKAKIEWFSRLENEVTKREQANKRIVFHPHFPAGYLLTSMRPAAGNVWWTYPISKAAADVFLQDHRHYSAELGLAVVVQQLFYSAAEIHPHIPSPLDKIGPEIAATLHHTFSSPAFDIYEKSPSGTIGTSP